MEVQLEHVIHAQPGASRIEDALRATEVSVDTCRVYAGDPVPTDITELDGLVGGPMSAGSSEGFPTRDAEIACWPTPCAPACRPWVSAWVPNWWP